MANAGPVELALVQSTRCKPDADAIVHQHFHPVSPAIGEQIIASTRTALARCFVTFKERLPFPANRCNASFTST
jgi:hypothetical protein